MITVAVGPDFEAFRSATRRLLVDGVEPANVRFQHERGQLELLRGEAPAPGPPSSLRIPKSFARLAELAICHRASDRFDLLYRVAFRLTRGEPALLELETDPDVLRLRELERQVSRDLHHLHAFVRFSRVAAADGEHFVAWHAPDHAVLRLAAPFFRARFPNQRWSILTPDESCSWDGQDLSFGPGVPRSAAPAADELAALFSEYYRAIFNPARLNLRAMQAELPRRHWATMPETSVVNELANKAPDLVRDMLREEPSAAAAYLPARESLPLLREAAAECRACALHEPATQTVFGEGDASARMMLIGEQPGDEEDLLGRPFVGPAGQLLERALQEAGISRSDLYVTNAVKHFKFVGKSGRRLHQRPHLREAQACRAWLDAELRSVQPAVVVCLGNTAASSLGGDRFNLTRYRGRLFRSPRAPKWLATWHPAGILRLADDAARTRAFEQLVGDLRLAWSESLAEYD